MSFRLARDAKCSETRLWGLIDQRAEPGADVESIDRRIWDLFGETWAIVFTDLSGFSRRSEEYGILHFLQTIHESHELLLPIVIEHDGVLIKSEADSFLLLFKRVERALECCLEMQRCCQQASARRVDEEKILLCIGMGFGRILRIGDNDAYGGQVNVASKLGEDTAEPNEILLSKEARDRIGGVEGVTFEQLDEPVSVSEINYRAVYEIKG
jgi:class 3 adenylate cyclase